jgi:hypothetical protein
VSDAEHPRCTDAVIVLPGLMGSELVDTASNEVLWGLSDPRWYVSAWTGGRSLRRLAVTDEDRAGGGRIRATGLLSAPAAAPVFHGAEPYTRLLAGVRRVAAHPDAVLAFPYDWRLSVEHNARQLAAVAERHLDRWRRHPYWGPRPVDPDDVRLSFVAHSMGGLVARQYIENSADPDTVRTVITLGTPFYGAVKAAFTLSTGHGAVPPLPRRRLRALARTLPGLHDLLPSYRCVIEPGAVRRLRPGDVTALGGDAELAAWALAGADRSWRTDRMALRPFVGVDQPTMQSLSLRDGVVEPLRFTREPGPDGTFRDCDYAGDTTVFRQAAGDGHAKPSYVPQTHVALARTDEAVAFVRTVLTEGTLGPPLPGVVPIGLDVPDVVVVGVDFEIVVLVPDASAVSCYVVDTATNDPLPPPRLRRGPVDGQARAVAQVDRPGIFRIMVKGGGYSAVSQLVLAVTSADLDHAD